MRRVSEGRLSTGVPFLRFGKGTPLVVASGMTAKHANPTGAMRRMSLAWAAPFAEQFTVYLLNRREGLAWGTTMADLAADYAGAIEQDIGEPVLLHGSSTGGFVGLQLAIDRPELVRRMVVSAAACRLAPWGRQVEAEVARQTQDGHPRRASALLMGALAPPRLRYPARGMGWMTGGGLAERSDMLRTLAAEEAFDAESDLGCVTAPTLVLGGTADPFFSDEVFRRTAAGIPGGRAVVLAGRSHGYVAGSKQTAGMSLGFLLG